MIGFCPLASGSKGNCIYFATKQKKILIDCGISGKATKNKLADINVDIADIDAIIVSHEHFDHIQGLKILACKMGIPVFANSETAKGIARQLRTCPKFKIFSTGERFEYGDLEIHPFTIPHDTPDPTAFTIKVDNMKIGFCTDLGFVTTLVTKQLKDCDYLYIEANHHPEMVHASPRPYLYKQRVLGRSGHLSNEACANLLQDIWSPRLKHIHLAHLSSECNNPELALSTIKRVFTEKATCPEISIAHQTVVSRSISF